MLKYLIVSLSQNSTSFCNYHTVNDSSTDLFVSPENLSEIILWAMKENLSIQFVYPNKRVPEELKSIVRSIDHINIVPETHADNNMLNYADIIVSDSLRQSHRLSDKIYILRLPFAELVASADNLKELIKQSVKVNAVITDVENFSKESIGVYRAFLEEMSDFIASEITNGSNVQFNLITDRMMLSKMNNCNAGYESIAAAIDGSLYPCPAFIGKEQFRCGDVNVGYDAPNLRLFQINNAPICKICDAFQCKRCVWLNHVLTHEVNTPGWQQCVISHLEREAARKTLKAIRNQIPDYLAEIEIPTIDYIDPYTKIEHL